MTRLHALGEHMVSTSNRFYLWMRDPRAWKLNAGEASDLDGLRGHRYCLLHTFKRSGEAVPTPVWFGLSDDRLYFFTGADAAKVRRIRATPHVRVAPCNARGKPLGPAVDAWARIVETGGEGRAEGALRSNYGLGRKLYEGTVHRLGVPGVYVEVVPQPLESGMSVGAPAYSDARS